MKTLLFLGFMCLFMSCHKYPDTVEQALKQAGDNRKELLAKGIVLKDTREGTFWEKQ